MFDFAIKVLVGAFILEQIVHGIAWLVGQYRDYEFQRYLKTLADYHEHLRRVREQEPDGR